LHYTLNAPRQYRVFSSILKEQRIDVVVAAHVLAGAAVIRAAKNAKVPVVFDLKDWFPDSAAAYYTNPALKWLIREGVWAVTRYNLDRSDRITTVSPSLVDQLKRHGYDAQCITNGVDTDYFKPLDGRPMRERLGLAQEDYVLGFAGSLERWYALGGVIDALPRIIERLPNARLLIVGDSLFTSYRQELEEQARRLGLADRVVFTGSVAYRELPGYIAAMDLCLIPLAPPQWVNIALPNKFFEYSACGKPILSTPIPDVARIGGPHLSIYRDAGEFLDMVHRLAAHRETFNVDVSGCSWKKKAEEFEGILARLAA
ncbi:MAG: glycosyltransferase, partial [Methanobacteriota archaeon]